MYTKVAWHGESRQRGFSSSLTINGLCNHPKELNIGKIQEFLSAQLSYGTPCHKIEPWSPTWMALQEVQTKCQLDSTCPAGASMPVVGNRMWGE